MTALRLLGWGLAAVLVALWLAVVEVFWLPLRIGGLLVPLSVVAAVTANLVLPEAARRLSGSRLIGILPAVVWLAVAIAAMSRRAEGDLVITGGGATGTINLAFLLLGVLAASLAVGRVLGGGPVVRPGAAPRERAGSGTGGAR
jgi:hypothetical protein